MIAGDRQRLDKWLWFARVTRTRTEAQKLAESGRVRLNRSRMDSAHHAVRPGDVLTIALPAGVRVLRIVAPGVRRGPPPDARLLYEDITPGRASGENQSETGISDEDDTVEEPAGGG